MVPTQGALPANMLWLQIIRGRFSAVALPSFVTLNMLHHLSLQFPLLLNRYNNLPLMALFLRIGDIRSAVLNTMLCT